MALKGVIFYAKKAGGRCSVEDMFDWVNCGNRKVRAFKRFVLIIITAVAWVHVKTVNFFKKSAH